MRSAWIGPLLLATAAMAHGCQVTNPAYDPESVALPEGPGPFVDASRPVAPSPENPAAPGPAAPVTARDAAPGSTDLPVEAGADAAAPDGGGRPPDAGVRDTSAPLDPGGPRDAAPPPDAATPPADDAAESAPAIAPDASSPHVSPAPPDAGRDGPTAHHACPPDPGLLLCFGFDGVIADESPRRQPTESAGLRFEPGLHGQALSPTAATFIRVPTSPALVPPRHTLEVVLKARTLPQGQSRMGVADDNWNTSIFVYANGTVRCSSGGTELFVPAVVEVDRWTTLACMYDGANVALWKDGALKGSRPATTALPVRSQTDFVVGSDNPEPGASPGDQFDGLVDHLRYWNRALPAGALCTPAGCP